MVTRGVPDHVRSDNGSEVTAGGDACGAGACGGPDAVHRAGQPRQSSFVKSFSGKLRDGELNRKSFETLPDARSLTAEHDARDDPMLALGAAGGVALVGADGHAVGGGVDAHEWHGMGIERHA